MFPATRGTFFRLTIKFFFAILKSILLRIFFNLRAGSSPGRAPRLHRGGSGFESCPVHCTSVPLSWDVFGLKRLFNASSRPAIAKHSAGSGPQKIKIPFFKMEFLFLKNFQNFYF